MKNVSLWTTRRGIALIAGLALVFTLTGGLMMQKAGAVAAPACSANSQTIVSDTTTQVDGHGAVAVTPHPAWTASIPGATWIYSDALDGNGSSPIGSKTFTKTFTISGTPVDSSLDIASDNYYTVSVNGNVIDTGTSATDLDNFHIADTWTIPASDLVSGSNTITITVTNPGTDPVSGNPFGDPNPAGLLYKLTANGQTCPDVTVTIVKYVDGQKANTEDTNGALFHMTSTWHAANLSGGATSSGNFDLGPTGFNTPNPYEAVTSDMTSGAYYKVVENDTPASCDTSEGYSLQGYHVGDSIEDALANATTSSAELTNITSNKVIVVMNHDCSAVPPTPPCVPDSPITTTFDTFTLGSVNGQQGWSVTNPAYDQEIVTNTYGYPTFGCQSLRVSDAVASGSFGDWIFSNSLANEAGETSAVNSGYSGGVRQNHFEAQFDIASTLPNTYQPGLHVSVSPDRGDGARMSYLRFEDQATSTHVFFDDYTNGDFNETDIAQLDRTVPHTIKFSMDFVDGANNDVVRIYIDGNLMITGGSWEDYFRDNQPAIAPPTVDSLIIQARGDSTPGDQGKGFLFDNVSLTSSTNPLLSPFVKVHIFKFVDNGDTTEQVPDDSTLAPFPMHASWVTSNFPSGEGDYVLGNNHGGATLRYAADTASMQTPVASYNTYERTTASYPESQVLPIGAECSADKFRLVGYKSGDTYSEALAAPIATTSPTFTTFSNDKYMIVVNEDCNNEEVGQPTLTLVKHTVGGNGTFHFFIAGATSTSTDVTTIENNGSVTIDLNEGTSTISELNTPGWVLTNTDCVYDNESVGNAVAGFETIHVDDGDHVTCTFTNTAVTPNNGSITVQKQVVDTNGVPVEDNTQFSVCLNNDSNNCQNISESTDGAFVELAPGTYTVKETPNENYSLQLYSQDNNSDSSDGAQVTVTSGNATNLVVVNKQIPTPSASSGGGGAAPQTGGFGGGSGGSGTQGRVLGTSTGPTIDTNPGVLPTCSTSYITEYMKYGKNNSPDQVTKLQTFLNEFQNAGLPVSGFFGQMTLAQVKAFQVSQEQYIRGPWANAGVPITNAEWPTGYVYKTTLWRINAIKCTTLNAPVPQLP